MSPGNNDDVMEELKEILEGFTFYIEYEVIDNPDKKWWQFWKPKKIVKKHCT
jgi:hypothetical protein